MKRATVFGILALVAAFIFGLSHLFQLRFEAGDIYPAYSSLRTDALGTKALYESFGRLIAVDRNYRPMARLDRTRSYTLLVLGVGPEQLELLPAELEQIESFVRSGGRVVISLFPSYTQTATNLPRRTVPVTADELIQQVKLTDKWGFEVDYAAVLRDMNGTYLATEAQLLEEASGDAEQELPPTISLHTAAFFKDLDDSWQVIYTRAPDRAVAIQRKVARGSIVLLADSYYFSNEALLKERQPQLLSWVVGRTGKAVFEETHLGVSESPGLAALARKYRLHGVLAGLLLVAVLFLWKNALPFPPTRRDAAVETADVVSGRESAAGFVHLLRRNLAENELLATCLNEWKKTCADQVPRGRLEQVQSLIDAENKKDPKQHNPVRLYRAIATALSRKRT